jgi:putative salt-induced outer membrane protein YdiY
MLILATLPNAATAQTPGGVQYSPSVTIFPFEEPVAKPVMVNLTAPGNTTTAETPEAKPSPVATTQKAAEPTPPTTPAEPLGWLGAQWSGRANVGASLQTGNTEQDAVNADASIKAKWLKGEDTKHRASIKAEINIENEDDTTTEDNRKLDLAYDYFYTKQWFLNTTLGFEQDDIEELDLRTKAGLGIGHQAFERDDLNLQYILGATYLREEFENDNTDDSLAISWNLDYDQKIWDDTFELFHEHELLVPTDDTEGFLLDTKSGIRLPIKNGIVASGEIDFDWNNDPPAGIKEDDTTYALKIGYEW